MKRSGWGDSMAASAARLVLGTVSHGQASRMGCHWLRSLSVRASTVHTLVTAASPPLRSTLIFIAGPWAFRTFRRPEAGTAEQWLNLDPHSFPCTADGVMLLGSGTEEVH